MIIGIVGSESIKFTPETEAKARAAIRQICNEELVSYALGEVVSGACPRGGIDIWAIEEAKSLGISTREFPPKIERWEGGYKQRNIQIAKASDLVVCITVKEYPPGYNDMRFSSCYHCHTSDHIKSGGCWTMKYAASLGKRTKLIVI